ncbi:hypothetical protein WN55_07593 [Dufourea novaeangliae]|uniref:HAUS augmin-like complex subunit 4 n=2 Tax=Dufourea novaeangliae TaxID=178035 RepID=A0A154P2M8_DUFNO|nr:hypothetical protein WN55_07593 [Dufourea novaeangliae]
MDSLQNLSEQQCSITYNASRNTTNLNQGTTLLQKSTKRLTLCEESIGDHIKNKIILQSIKEASNNTKLTLSADVITKLKGLLSIHEVNKYMHLPSISKKILEKLTVLGITDLPEYDLTHKEKLDIKCYVEALLREKILDFILRYKSLGGNMKEVLGSNNCNIRKKLFELHEIQMLQWKDKMNELCDQLRADVIKLSTLLNKWKTKSKEFNRINLEKVEYMLLQFEVAQEQAKIIKLTCITRMFKETPVTIDAYKTLNEIIDEKLFATMNEIKEKENLKKEYESLQNTEYSSILNTYLEFCKAVRKKRQILEKL